MTPPSSAVDVQPEDINSKMRRHECISTLKVFGRGETVATFIPKVVPQATPKKTNVCNRVRSARLFASNINYPPQWSKKSGPGRQRNDTIHPEPKGKQSSSHKNIRELSVEQSRPIHYRICLSSVLATSTHLSPNYEQRTASSALQLPTENEAIYRPIP